MAGGPVTEVFRTPEERFEGLPDHAGFGRSDKPIDPAWQSLERQVAVTGTLLEELDLRDVTLVGHDWGMRRHIPRRSQRQDSGGSR